LLLSLIGHPIDVLVLEHDRESRRLASFPVPLGRSIMTRYEHSVERTPVDDIYYLTDGALRQWRTRTRSHNAGLPWSAPERGRFMSEDPWLVLEGGLLAWDEVRLRVGNGQLGRNELFIGDEVFDLYVQVPGVRLRMLGDRKPLLCAMGAMRSSSILPRP
jgi:hypothetical protein